MNDNAAHIALLSNSWWKFCGVWILIFQQIMRALFRSWVTGGATIELELALAEKAGLRVGYSTPEPLLNRDRFKVDQMKLISSPFR